jgi:hypothetical protein
MIFLVGRGPHKCVMKARRMQLWEENSGINSGLKEADGYLQLDFGSFQVLLNLDECTHLRDRLERSIGRRISLIRTDIPGKELLMIDL